MPESAAPSVDEQIRKTRPLRVMLLDDEEVVRELAVEMIGKLGHSVTAFGNCREAISHYETFWRDTDLVVLDMIMPQMNGRDVFRELKAINPRVIVLLSSGYSVENEAQEISRDGVAGFLNKPYRLSDLKHKIDEVIVAL